MKAERPRANKSGPDEKALERTVILRSAGQEFVVKVQDGTALVPKGMGQAFSVRTTRVKLPAQLPGKWDKVNLSGLKDVPEYGPSAVTQRLVKALGNNAVAALLGVNKDRPSRWASGSDVPNDENRTQLTDLDSLVGHLHNAFTSAQAKLWLEGQDPYLGARPIDVFRLEGSAPVIEAIHAYEQGAFA